MQTTSERITNRGGLHAATHNRAVLMLVLLVAAAFFQSCNTPVNFVRGIELIPGQTLRLNEALSFRVSGVGTCKLLRVDWGDGTHVDFQNSDLTAHPTATHIYSGWHGGKTATAIGVDGCDGRASTRFQLEPMVYVVAFAAGPQICSPVPPALPSDIVEQSLVHVTTVPLTGFYSFGIDFGCPAGGCRYNADGKPGSVAAPPFPFPGLREYSLVFRIGSDAEQGGTDRRFTTAQAGPLEVCLNDNNPADNRGGYEIHLTVNQLGPAPPP